MFLSPSPHQIMDYINMKITYLNEQKVETKFSSEAEYFNRIYGFLNINITSNDAFTYSLPASFCAFCTNI